MIRFLFALLFSFCLYSCGNNAGDPKEQPLQEDLFRADVMKFRNAGLLKSLSGHEVDSLIGVFRDSLNGLQEILSVAGDLLMINISTDNKSIESVYRNVLDTIAYKYPDLKCEDPRFTYLPDIPGEKDTGWVSLRVKYGNSFYERRLYYFKAEPVDVFVYRLFNLMLTDSGSSERLFMSTFRCRNCNKDYDFMGNVDRSRFGLLRLSRAQADSLLTVNGLDIEPENEFDMFPSKQVWNEVKNFEKSGLIGKADSSWYPEAKEMLLATSIYSREDLYDMLDTFICTVNFETYNEYNPYSEIIQYLASASRGKFNPGGLDDLEMNPTMRTVRFVLNGKTYESRAESRGDMISPHVIDDVNNALSDQKIPGAFYTVMTRDKVCQLVFIDNTLAEQVKASGFFPDFEKGVSQEIKARYEGMGVQ